MLPDSFSLSLLLANYSKPTVTVSHEKTPGCRGYLVRCDSYGGYPSSKVTWKTPETWNTSHMWKLLNNSEHQDQVTQLFNVSSTACFNCSNVMQEEFLSCSVGDVMSDMVSVCEYSTLKSFDKCERRQKPLLN